MATRGARPQLVASLPVVGLGCEPPDGQPDQVAGVQTLDGFVQGLDGPNAPGIPAREPAPGGTVSPQDSREEEPDETDPQTHGNVVRSDRDPAVGVGLRFQPEGAGEPVHIGKLRVHNPIVVVVGPASPFSGRMRDSPSSGPTVRTGRGGVKGSLGIGARRRMNPGGSSYGAEPARSPEVDAQAFSGPGNDAGSAWTARSTLQARVRGGPRAAAPLAGAATECVPALLCVGGGILAAAATQAARSGDRPQQETRERWRSDAASRITNICWLGSALVGKAQQAHILQIRRAAGGPLGGDEIRLREDEEFLAFVADRLASRPNL